MSADSDTVQPESLIRYLRDLAGLRMRPVLDVANYEFVMWFKDVPAHRSCRSAVEPGQLSDRPEWLTVERVQLPERPDAPDQTHPWISGTLDNPSEEPELHDSLIHTETLDSDDGPIETEVTDLLGDHPEVIREWASYLDRWREWSDEYLSLTPVHRLYTDLFRAAERARQVGEQYETLVAVGLVALKGELGIVKRHLLTAPAQISLDAETGQITVEPSSGANTAVRLEQDMLAAAETPPSEVLADMQRQIRDLDPLDLEAATPILETWSNAASASGRFETDLSPDVTPSTELVLRLAPALLTRPRSQQAVVDTYKAILDAMADEGPIPATFADLTQSDAGKLSEEERKASGLDLDSEQWFPLPANDEQAQIVRALRNRRGVIVHGPPGTGKSHTIANLISHALATGQRVLVTAHSARALEVLSEKLPDDIRQLTVTMLGEGRRGTDDLERSANEILRRRQDTEWQPAGIDRRLKRLGKQLSASREQRTALLTQLGSARAVEADRIDLGFGGYAGTLATLSEQLAGEPEAPSWILSAPNGPPPISDGVLDELLTLRERLSNDDLALAKQGLPLEQDVPTPESVLSALSALEVSTSLVSQCQDITTEILDQIERLSEAALKEYLAASAAEQDAAYQVTRRNSDWAGLVLTDLERGQAAHWRALWSQTSEFLNAEWPLAECDQLQIVVAPVSNPSVLRSQAEGLVSFFRSGGKIRRLKQKPVKEAAELLEAVTVNGAAPETLQRCEQFISWYDACAAVELIERSWPEGVLAPQPTLVLRSAAIIDAVQALVDCFSLHDRRTELAELVSKYQINTTILPARDDLIQRALSAASAHTQHFAALGTLQAMVLQLAASAQRPDANPVSAELVAALEEKDPRKYNELCAQLSRSRRLAAQAEEYQALLGSLTAVNPECSTIVESGRGSELRPFEEQWDRARARHWLEIHQKLDANQVTKQITTLNNNVRDLITQIGANKAWLHAIGRLTESHTQHLKAYQTSMKRVGKGNSKYDLKYRQEARAHLAQCQDAVPAWVMPAHQVAANVAPVAGSFDLVIIDEASQSGVEELFLFWLGKQVVVVGDKHQISPEGSFVKGEAQELQRRHLDGWSFAGEFGPENSLFDVAEVKFVEGEVWLSEHFRSMPEIIEYSNQLCYANHRLQPVRQFGTDRLPPLRSTLVPHVPDGRSVSGNVNRDEADALVAQLLKCLEDPLYRRADGTPATFGVISLRGADQAKLIQQRLLQLVDTDTWIERKIHVGDAADFQGDERDIVFLSMVTTPLPDGRRNPKLGNDRDIRRFNVAASRARDQLWLFHSVGLDHLNPECPRARLIAHIKNPTRAGLEGYNDPVDPNERSQPFDSLFEQRVFLDLTNRGYVVEPQWKVLGYRIDLVVIGSHARLAVECDGDAWHGPDRYAADLARQGDLERVGWTFVRIKEWEYYADHAAALAPLWKSLESLDIGPGGESGGAPSDVDTPDTQAVSDDSQTPPPLPPDMHIPPPFTGGWTEPDPSPGEDSDPPAQPIDETASLNRDLPIDVALPKSKPPAPSAHPDSKQPPPPRVRRIPAIDPRSALPRQLLDTIKLILSIEGPAVTERVFRIMNGAAGNKRIGENIRASLFEALALGLADGTIFSDDPLDQGQLLATVRLADQPPVDIRPRGERDFEHIPPREIAARLTQLQNETGYSGHALYRYCHREYGFSRLGEATAEHYEACATLSGE